MSEKFVCLHRLIALTLVMLIGWICTVTEAVAGNSPPDGRCYVIDTDVEIDDVRAILLVARTGRVAAIIVTEGVSRTPEGVGALREALKRSRQNEILVIRGASPNPKWAARLGPRFLSWRENAERLNRLLEAPAPAPDPPTSDIAAALRPTLERCHQISLLILGPWTSFLRYAPEILGSVDRIVAQGRPYPDEASGHPEGFNCRYDVDSCFAAFDLLSGRQQRADRRVRTDWVDVPGGLNGCGMAEPGVNEDGVEVSAFRPVAEWVEALAQVNSRTTQFVAEMLRGYSLGWEKTKLWDDLAALYLLRPEVFALRGGHQEPCLSAETIRRMLTAALAADLPPWARTGNGD